MRIVNNSEIKVFLISRATFVSSSFVARHDFLIGQIQNKRSSQHLPAADIATNKSIQHVINF